MGYFIKELHDTFPWISDFLHQNKEKIISQKFNSPRVDIIRTQLDQEIDKMISLDCFIKNSVVGYFLAENINLVLNKLLTLNSADYIVGIDGSKNIVERGGQFSKQKGELSELIKQIKISDGLIDWSSLTTKERSMLCKLFLTNCIGGKLEEFNRIKSLENLTYFIARKITAIEHIDNVEYFKNGFENILQLLYSFLEKKKKILNKYQIEKVLLSESKFKFTYIAKETACEKTEKYIQSILSTHLTVINKSTVDSDKLNNLIEKKGGIFSIVALIIDSAREILSDNITVQALMTNRKVGQGNYIFSWASMMGKVYGFKSKLGIRKEDPAFMVEEEPFKILEGSLYNELIQTSWRYTIDDIKNGIDEKIVEKRLFAHQIENGLNDGMTPKFEAKMMKTLFTRLAIVNCNKKLKGMQLKVQSPNLTAHQSYSYSKKNDGYEKLVNPGHALIGAQAGILYPLPFDIINNMSDIRFFRESGREISRFTLKELPVAKTYTLWVNALIQSYIQKNNNL